MLNTVDQIFRGRATKSPSSHLWKRTGSHGT